MSESTPAAPLAPHRDSGRGPDCTQPETCGTASDPAELCSACEADFEAWRADKHAKASGIQDGTNS